MVSESRFSSHSWVSHFASRTEDVAADDDDVG